VRDHHKTPTVCVAPMNHIFSTALSQYCGGVPRRCGYVMCRFGGTRRHYTSPQQSTEQFQIWPLLLFCCSIHILLFSYCSRYAI